MQMSTAARAGSAIKSIKSIKSASVKNDGKKRSEYIFPGEAAALVLD